MKEQEQANNTKSPIEGVEQCVLGLINKLAGNKKKKKGTLYGEPEMGHWGT